MLVECPGCKKRFRAFIEEGHMQIEYKDIHGDKHTVHSDTCKCNKKKLIREREHGATDIE